MKRVLLIALVVACLAALTLPAQAHTIGQDDVSFGLVSGTASWAADTQTAALTYEEVDDIYMFVTVWQAGEYTINADITNSSEAVWSDFNWELVVLNQDGTAWDGVAPEGLVFTAVVAPTIFPDTDLSADKLTVSGGLLADPGVFSATYTVNVPGPMTFAVKQYDFDVPSEVPTPGTGVALASLAMTAAAGYGVRRRKA